MPALSSPSPWDKRRRLPPGTPRHGRKAPPPRPGPKNAQNALSVSESAFLIDPSGAVPAYSPIEQHNPPAIQRDRGATPGSEFPLMVNLRFLRDMQVSRFPIGLLLLTTCLFLQTLASTTSGFPSSCNSCFLRFPSVRAHFIKCVWNLLRVGLNPSGLCASRIGKEVRSTSLVHWTRSFLSVCIVLSILDFVKRFCEIF